MATKVKTDTTKSTAKGNSKAEPKASRSDRSAADVPAGDRRLALVKLLRKMGATKRSAAIPVSQLAEKLGYNTYDVYCLGYHKFHLAKAGLVEANKVADSRELHLSLTTKGAKADDDTIRGK